MVSLKTRRAVAPLLEEEKGLTSLLKALQKLNSFGTTAAFAENVTSVDMHVCDN